MKDYNKRDDKKYLSTNIRFQLDRDYQKYCIYNNAISSTSYNMISYLLQQGFLDVEAIRRKYRG